jgi:hypothetical protein
MMHSPPPPFPQIQHTVLLLRPFGSLGARDVRSYRSLVGTLEQVRARLQRLKPFSID